MLLQLKTVPRWKKFSGVGYVLGVKVRFAVFRARTALVRWAEVEGFLPTPLQSWLSFFAPTLDHPPHPKSPTSITFHSPLPSYLLTLKAMRQHKSQLVWFRWLYVGWSKYMWVGEVEVVG